MSRLAIWISACAVILMVLPTPPASAIPPSGEAWYLLTIDGIDDRLVVVKEQWQPLSDGRIRYNYEVWNDGQDPSQLTAETGVVTSITQSGFGPDTYIIEFGYTEALDGGPIEMLWNPPVTPAWSVTGETGGTPTPVWTVSPDTSGIPFPDGLETFRYKSAGVAHRLYDAYAVAWKDDDGDGVIDPGETTTYEATGKISGPTPEPCTLGLLGLSGLAMIRLFKRKRE
jgi:hypothetical protein